ncbi:hypothetical protein FOF72_05280 [Lactobacillus jensenii]|jgi:hypothetical protein|uniref:Tripartite tricarboxylate transporter TctB family protein n=3 Tax=Lactobacillaceae TaxID=33958 RepID=A0A2I1XPN3_LACJE|nr:MULTISPECIES: hypothetical protein [Lactobacillus]MCZ3543297.1 hypothetical protein [Lactobacillus gasseri]EEX28218.1 hypothetical protein HMPREF0527_00453 [Lactobacillus jensenii SJ-7A-US]KAA9233659.1 hypothetical protein F6I36_08045 [Lactobacillus jensenii]KAA9258435.1 hypothetical protein F6I24_05135 [Lactobacillus jensenii]KAA9320100.1 hypothetical protein F6H94_08475 [Lactobacillus jensenii]
MIKKRKKLFKKIIHLMDLIVTFIRFSGSFIIFALFAFVLSSRPLGKDTLKYIELFIPLLSLAIVNICTTVSRICKLIIPDFTAEDEEGLSGLILLFLLPIALIVIYIILSINNATNLVFVFMVFSLTLVWSLAFIPHHPSRLGCFMVCFSLSALFLKWTLMLKPLAHAIATYIQNH